MLSTDPIQKNLNGKKTVVVGMSGGVDSSVSALILKELGYNVIGIYMKNWEEQDERGVCRSVKDFEDVIKVCEQIQIPYYTINFVKEYHDHVFTHFLNELKAGFTPNPDILCNREIKFKVFFEKAMSLGADFLATGHYCQNHLMEGQQQLWKGADRNKDQSYFLYTITQNVLEKVLFPVGSLPKGEVRRIARHYHLATSDKKDSTGVCFIGERNFKQFLSQHLKAKPGFFENMKGEVVGKHDGIPYYTIGQRRGLGVGGAGDAWFVVGKDIQRNVVFIDQGSKHPAMYADDLKATELSWIAGHPPTQFPFLCKSKIRYRQPDQECTITSIENGVAHVKFTIPQRAITQRQSIVFYVNDLCLGGGIIVSSGPTYHERGISLPENVSL